MAATQVSRCWSFLASLVDRDSTSCVSDGDRDLRVEGGKSTADDCDCDLFKKSQHIYWSHTLRHATYLFLLCCVSTVEGESMAEGSSKCKRT